MLYIPDCQRPTGAVHHSSTADEGRTAPKNKDELGYTARRKIKREKRKGGGGKPDKTLAKNHEALK